MYSWAEPQISIDPVPSLQALMWMTTKTQRKIGQDAYGKSSHSFHEIKFD